MPFVGALALVVAVVVLRKRFFGPIDRNDGPWLDAWLRALVIGLVIVLLVAVIPAKVLELHAVTELDAKLQDLIGSGLSLGGLAVAFVGLRLAQKHGRI